MLFSSNTTKKEKEKPQTQTLKEMSIFQLLHETFKYEKAISTTPQDILQELLKRIAPSYILQGLECIRGEGAILKARSPFLNPETKEQKEVAVKVLRPSLNLSLYQKISKSEIKNSNGMQQKVLAVRSFKMRFEAGIEVQKYVRQEIERSGIDYFSVPRINYNSDVPCAFLEMEWIDGVNILRWLKGENDVKYSIEKFCTLLDCVQFCHDLGIIHRDIKADNIMVGGRTRKEEKLFLLDWTTGKPIDDPNRKLTMVGEGLGTPGYSDFSQLEGGQAKNADVRNDIYSLGLVLFEFWHNQFVPRLQDDEYADLEKRQAYLAALSRKLPAVLGNIFQRATCLDRTKRYKDCRDFKSEIVQAIDRIISSDKGKRVTIDELNEDMAKYEDSFARVDTEIETIVDTSTSVENTCENIECEFCKYNGSICSKYNLCNSKLHIILELKKEKTK